MGTITSSQREKKERREKRNELVYQTMKRILLVTLLATCLHLVPAEDGGDNEDVGTVIGIDLGTTYSW